jgi:predicted Zn-ribbon and HTH transcriptional regulator
MPLDGRGVMVTAVLAGGLVAFAILSAARRMDVARANALFIKHKVCVCCGYELKSLPEEADGCVVCPECGAAWQFGPRGRDTPQ